jgi:hypothetical protein
MIRATEMRMAIIVQNQASFALSRIGRDFAALQRQTDIAHAKQMAQLRELELAQKRVAIQAKLTDLRSGAAQQAAITAGLKKQVSLRISARDMISKEATLQRGLYDLETKRMAMQQKLSVLQRTGGTQAGMDAKILQRNLVSLNMQEDILRGNLSTVRIRMEQLDKEILEQAEALKVLQSARVRDINAIKAQQTALARLRVEQAMATQATKDLAMAEARAPLDRLGAKGRALSHIGRGATLFGGVGLVALGATASSFANFNISAAKAATQMRGVNESFQSAVAITPVLQQRILNLTREFPASAQEMTDASYQIASGMDFQGNSVQRLAQTMKVLRSVNQVAVAGQTDLASATDSVITVLNNFDPTGKHINKTLNTMFAIVRFGRGDFTQFEQLFGTVASAARQAGQNLTEAGGALAYLTTVMNRSQAAVGYARLIQIMGRKEFTEGFKALFHVPETIGTGIHQKLKPLSDIITIMTTLGPKLGIFGVKGGTDLQNLIRTITAAGKSEMTGKPNSVGLQGTIQAQKALTFLITGWRTYRDVLNNVASDQTEFNKSLEAIQKTPGFKWQLAVNQFKALAIIIGQSVLPVMLRFVGKLTDLAHKFESLPKPIRNLIGQFGAWASIMFLLGGLFSIFAGSLLSAYARLGTYILGLERATAAAKALQIATRGLLGLGAIVITVYFITHFKSQRRDMFGHLDEWLKKKLTAPGGNFNPMNNITLPIRLGLTLDEKMRGYDAAKVARLKKIAAAKYQADFKDFTATVGRETLRIAPIASSNIAMAIQSAQQNWKKSIMLGGKSSAVPAKTFFDNLGFNAFLNLNKLDQTNTKTTDSVLSHWQNLAGQLTAMDVFGNMSQQAATAATKMQIAMDQALASGNVAQQKAILQQQIAFDRRKIAPYLNSQGLPKKGLTPANLDKLHKLYTDLNSKQDQLKSLSDHQTNAQDRTTKAVDRTSLALQNQQDRVTSLKQKVQELNRDALDKLRSAFGSIGGGPISQGPIGSAFSNIANQLGAFGIPFKIPASLTLKDQNLQQKNFNELMGYIKILRGINAQEIKKGKKGTPFGKEIDQIMQTGATPENLAMLRGVMGNPATRKQFIKNLKTEEKSFAGDKNLLAANTQLAAAKINLRIAERNLGHDKRVAADAKAKAAAAKKTTTTKDLPPKSGNTRTTQGVTHNTHYHVNAVAMDPHKVVRAISIAHRNRGPI